MDRVMAASEDDCDRRSTGLRTLRGARKLSVSHGWSARPSLEPLLPGFLSASAAMSKVVEQIHRLQGSELTVLITGESGTAKS